MTFQKRNWLKDTAGYTIDQTILIVAIIAILVTLIIITVGWQLINRTTGAKLASQFRQIEDAIGQFYGDNQMWPHLSYTGTVSNAANMQALAGSGVTFRAGVTARNYVPGFNGLTHSFGDGGAITMTNITTPYGNVGQYLVVQFASVPFSDVREAEEAIDGGTTPSYSAGRVTASTGANCLAATVPTPATTMTGDTTLVSACYVANLIQ